MTRKLLFLWAVLCMALTNAAAQGRKVTGTVKDKEGAALPGVTIREAGTPNGTVTGADGSFSLTLKLAAPTLEFTFMGYSRQLVKVDGRERYAVVLLPDAQALKDVVVVGYQTMTRKTATTSISSVKGDVIENLPAPSFESLLQGRVTGVNIQNFSGDPGVRNSIVVRGNSRLSTDLDEARALSTPLYVIDGVPMSVDDLMGSESGTQTNTIAGINPNDIEDMQVLKDAAATSVWGSRGANGVIVIKTRRGKLGKPEFRMNYYQGFVARPRLLKTTVGAEERWQKLGIINEYGNYLERENIPIALTDSLNPSFNNAVDWQDMFYRNGGMRNADLSVSNGTDNFNYRISANYYNEEGVVRNTGFARYALRGNLNFTFSPKLSGFTNLSLSRANRKRGLGNDQFAASVPIQMHELPSSLLYVTPEMRKAYMDKFDKLRDINLNDLLMASIGIKYKVLPDLEYNFMGSATITREQREYFLPSTLNPDEINVGLSTNKNYNTYYLENSLAYRKTFGDHHLYLTAIQNFERNQGDEQFGAGSNMPNDDIQVIGGVPQRNKSIYTTYRAAGLLSYVGQLQYDFKERYLFSASWRADASSRFGPDTKWGKFYSVGAGWLLSDEPFFEPLKDVVSYAKVRGSWGTSGEQFDQFYATYNRFVIPSYYNGTAAYLPDYAGGYGLAKRNFTWSQSRQFNVGFDAFLFKGNRINLTVDYYDRLSGRAFNTFEMPFWAGFDKLTANYDINIRNRGVEVQIITKNLPDNSVLRWNTNLNFSINQNRITKLPNGDKSYYRSDKHGVLREYTVGKPAYTMAQMEYQGVYNNWNQIPFNPSNGSRITYFKGNRPVMPGFPIWNDLNGDYDVWSDEDRGDAQGDVTATGNPNPRVTGGFVNDFYYKNFSLTIATTFTLGRDIINSFRSKELDRAYIDGVLKWGNRRIPDMEGVNYWRPSGLQKDGENYRADFPSLSPFGYYYQFFPFSTMFNQKGDYFKVKFISLGYNFNGAVLRNLKLSGIRLYGTIDNLLMIQRADVPDAEQVDPFGIYTGSGYPIPRKFTLGLDVKF